MDDKPYIYRKCTLEDIDVIKSKQNNRCAICGQAFSTMRKRSIVIDHDHMTGVIRGILCARCNNMLGMALDNPYIMLAGVDYIIKFMDMPNPIIIDQAIKFRREVAARNVLKSRSRMRKLTKRLMIATLLDQNYTRDEIMQIVGITRENLRKTISRIKREKTIKTKVEE